METEEANASRYDFERSIAAEIGSEFLVCVGMDGMSDVSIIIDDIIINSLRPEHGHSNSTALGIRVWLEIVRSDGLAVRAAGKPKDTYSEPPDGFRERIAAELAKPQNAEAFSEIGHLYAGPRIKLVSMN